MPAGQSTYTPTLLETEEEGGEEGDEDEEEEEGGEGEMDVTLLLYMT